MVRLSYSQEVSMSKLPKIAKVSEVSFSLKNEDKAFVKNKRDKFLNSYKLKVKTLMTC